MKRFIKLSAPVAAVALALALPASAATLSSFEGDIKVTYQASELTSRDGQNQVYQRLRQAANKACGSSSIRITGNAGIAAQNRACYTSRLEQAVREVDHPAVYKLHNS